MEHYKTLGVDSNASPDDIKKAYRKMAGIHHPDKGGNTATFQKIQQAYETLSDPQKKQQYDNPNPFGGGMHSTGGMHGGFPGGFQFHMNGFDMNDVFGQMFGQQRHPQRPTYKTTLWVTLEQVYKGDEQTLQFNTNGENNVVNIQIPKGVDNGATLRYDNLIRDGVLIVEFRIHQHTKFQRHGFDLVTEHEISVLDLIVGVDIKFTTISGKTLEVKIKPKTQPNTTLRIPGEGLPTTYGYGDQMILLKPVIPDMISDSVINSIILSRK